ncbi:hypothetical protein EVAR_56827_1 [Eumeta japonica]|uniref:Uncharacterized protein n=1 Tax=Eumeta variegata TaxID=151549 RepID=A0A4C1ZFS6_EUMVA|nr:hypothetical protein EVAR_56827_1 [Eumeta japonica]
MDALCVSLHKDKSIYRHIPNSTSVLMRLCEDVDFEMYRLAGTQKRYRGVVVFIVFAREKFGIKTTLPPSSYQSEGDEGVTNR